MHFTLIIDREHLIEQAISTLVNPGTKAADVGDAGRRTKTSDVLQYITLLNDTYLHSSTLTLATRDEVGYCDYLLLFRICLYLFNCQPFVSTV